MNYFQMKEQIELAITKAPVGKKEDGKEVIEDEVLALLGDKYKYKSMKEKRRSKRTR